jgi:hypothetical protein
VNHSILWLSSFSIVLAAACVSLDKPEEVAACAKLGTCADNGAGGVRETGGTSGGTSGAGGSVGATGGVVASGGLGPTAGDSLASGGSMTTNGGAVSSGGRESTTGGTLGSGGATIGAGGTLSTGGAVATGGRSPAVGGSVATGGSARGTGGIAATGGTKARTGGVVSTGGTTAGPGAVVSTGGTMSPPPAAMFPGAACTTEVKDAGCTGSAVCYRYCGPESQGYKSEICNGSKFLEGDCTFSDTTNYACYSLTSVAACATTPPTTGSTCTISTCKPCGSSTTTGYKDSSGSAKIGYCVCTSDGKWSCAGTTTWPCPNGTGC